MEASPQQPHVQFEGVSKRYGKGSLVLAGIDFQAQAGEFISVIGPSGCGKSTWLRLLAGLIEPTEGRVRIAGNEPSASRERIAFIFQDATLLPWLNVQRNIELPLKMRGIRAVERQRTARQLLELVGLEHVGDHYPRQLSGGMKMRVSLARGLSVQPNLLLMDEPFGALDAMTRNRLNEELLELRRAHAFTTFFVTHSVGEAVFLSNRVITLTANPGTVASVLEVPLPYPRTAETREDTQYLQLVAEANHRLHTLEH